MTLMDGGVSRTTTDFVLQLCETVNTPRSLYVYLLVKYGEWDQLVNLTIDASLYENPDIFRMDYLCTEILRKYPLLPTGIDTAAKALEAYYEGEEICENANMRILKNPPSCLGGIARQVERTIGTLTSEDLNLVQNLCGNGSGATVCLRGSGTVKSDKIRRNYPTITRELVPFARALMGERWTDLVGCFVIVDGNTFFTVPKSAKTDRGCSKEPRINLFLQKGIGKVIRRKLKRAGCNLNDQSVNQTMASRAQRDGLATIDLSMASDTISWSLVWSLLPPRWFELLDLARSRKTLLPDGTWKETAKFSSMGNGFTFELESLLFLSIARSIVPRKEWGDVSVYGDDIICPQRYAASIVDTLELLGLKVNRSKSFLAGTFFESCGADFHSGVNVRPFYLRSHPRGLPWTMIIANKLRVWSKLPDGTCDSRFRELWLTLFRSTGREWRACTIPEYMGDRGFIVSRREVKQVGRLSKNEATYESYVSTRILSLRPVARRYDDVSTLLNALAPGNPETGPFDDQSDGVFYADPASLLRSWINEGKPSSIVDELGLYTRGFEPVRGYLRKPRTVTRGLYFPSGDLEWS